MLEFFQFLERNKVYPNTIEKIFDWDDTSLADFTKQCFLKIDHQTEINNSPFVFTANNELGGGTFPCSHLPCRIINIRKLSIFTILYADKVLINNPFYDYLEYESFNANLKNNLANDLLIIYDIKDLLLNGYITFFDPFIHMCRNCYKHFEKKVEEFDKILDDLYEYTYSYLLEETEYKIEYSHGKIAAVFNGPKEIFGHDENILTFNDAPQIFKQKLINTDVAKLNNNEVSESGIVDHHTNILLNDIVTQHWHKMAYNSSYLTNRSYDFDLLKYLDEYHNRNAKIFDALSHNIPFLKGVDYAELLKLRHNETESFEVYRDKLTEIFREEKSYTDNEAKDIYYDYLRPELNKIDKALRDNKASIKSKLANEAVFYGSAITIGLSSGFITPELGKIIASIGGLDFAKELFMQLQNMHNNESDIRKNDFYFLWKVKNSLN